MLRLPALPLALRAVCALAAGLVACTDPDIRRGDDALGLGRYGEAIGAYQAARTRLPHEATPKARLASAHRTLAANLMQSGKCEEARGQLALAEDLSPPVLVDHQLLYECDSARNASKERLIADLKVLLGLKDYRASVLRMLLHFELDLGQDADAVSRLEALQKRSALTLEERRLLAEAFLRLERHDEAWPHLRAVVAAEPAVDPVRRLKLAELAEGRAEFRIAQEIYEKLVQEMPENPLTWLRLAEFRQRIGDAPGAALALARADALRNARLPPPQEMRPLRKSRR